MLFFGRLLIKESREVTSTLDNSYFLKIILVKYLFRMFLKNNSLVVWFVDFFRFLLVVFEQSLERTLQSSRN